MKQIFHAVLPIKPQTWKRTEGKSHRYMPKELREYYHALYAEMVEAGMKPVANNAELKLEITFYNTDGYWRDTSNLLKAFEDSGQPSKWTKKVGYRDFWDDKQFSDIHVKRVMKAYVDQITVSVWEL